MKKRKHLLFFLILNSFHLLLLTEIRKKGYMESDIANQPFLPEHVITSHVLPFLPFKALAKLKLVNHNWNKLVSEDDNFALDQSCRSSSISNAILFAASSQDKKLIFLSTDNNSSIGIPDPSLSFLNLERTKVLASTNGILCVQRLASEGVKRCIYVCNPATGESHLISNCFYDYRESFGLAFDPETSPHCYKLVTPIRSHIDGHFIYSFNVFSSESGQWVFSKQTITTAYWADTKSIYCNRVLYWDCTEFLLAFDPWNDIADVIMLPEFDPDYAYFRQDVNVYRNSLACIRIDKKYMNVWVLRNNKKWESKYSIVLDDMIEANQEVFRDYCYMVKKRRVNISDSLTIRYDIFPLPYEGGERLLFALTTSKNEKSIFSYDVKSGEVEMISVSRPVIGVDKVKDELVFSYHNSMAKLPRLFTGF